jgi:hypothetical protein
MSMLTLRWRLRLTLSWPSAVCCSLKAMALVGTCYCVAEKSDGLYMEDGNIMWLKRRESLRVTRRLCALI